MKEKSTYSGTYRVRIGDINYGGHMGNDKALLLFHDARLYFLGQHGFAENDIGGPGLIMGEAHVYFKKEVFRGDELKVNIHIEDLYSFSFVMHYTVMRDEEEVMHGSTKLIAFNYDKRKVAKIPDAFLMSINM
ncbi:MAG: thioesterase family protein [Bacteroidales bacterium]|nr:thioesterase family protein [Bacteroidales bacterium]